MKKLERLKFIAERFGPEFVLPYYACYSWPQIVEAVNCFESRGRTWGFRTDVRDGWEQGFQLPFVLHGTLERILEVWEANGPKLEYIVGQNVTLVIYHAVAIPVDNEHVFFEWNDQEPTISQRAMYNHPENLSQILVGPARRSDASVIAQGMPFPVMKPEDCKVVDLGFDRVYRLMVGQNVDEITFTVRANDRKMIIW